jgi:FKBP-type peptidyl-prolyl cis-trans isomerase 2
MVREALKQGMKTWIATGERVRMKVAVLRVDLEDVVAEARQEYAGQAATYDRARVQSEARPTPTAKPKARHAHANREDSAKATGDAKKTTASA